MQARQSGTWTRSICSRRQSCRPSLGGMRCSLLIEDGHLMLYRQVICEAPQHRDSIISCWAPRMGDWLLAADMVPRLEIAGTSAAC